MSDVEVKNAADFINQLIDDPAELLEIAELPSAERPEAIRALGFEFTSRELDDLICEKYWEIKDKMNIGPGDIRDIVVQKWGHCMG